MIFADTTLVSQIVRRKPDPGVIAWIAAHEDELHLSTVVIAEISFGIERITPQERARHLAVLLEEIRGRYAKRLHGFDETAALIFGRIMGEASRSAETSQLPTP